MLFQECLRNQIVPFIITEGCANGIIFYIHGADVEVTAILVQSTIHDFVMLNALDQTEACRIAMDASTQWINRKNHLSHVN